MENGVPRRRHPSINNSVTSIQNEATEDKDIFSDNRNRLIDNPFRGMQPDAAAQYGREFAEANELALKAAHFENAGRVLQDPEEFESLDELSDDDKAALRLETRSNELIVQSLSNFVRGPSRYRWRVLWKQLFPNNGFWKQPKPLRSTTIMLSWAAIVQGWCQASSNGANLNWAIALLGTPSNASSSDACDPIGGHAWIFALVNAAPYLAASLFGCWLSDPLSERFIGRRAPIAISTVAIIASAIGSAFVQKGYWPLLLLCRIILGLGMGMKAAIVPVYAAEIAPAHLRGSLVMNWQLFDAFGILAGFTANIIAAQSGDEAWRWQFASAALPALILIGQIYAAPESPRFLMKQEKYVDAYNTFEAFRGAPILAAKELLYTHKQMEIEMKLLSLDSKIKDVERQSIGSRSNKSSKRIGFFRKLRTIFVKPRTRRSLLAAWVVMLAQQLCGINVLIFYSSTVYGDLSNACGQSNPSHHLRPLFLSWGVGLTNFIFAFPAYWLIDRRGRRFLLLTTLPLMALSMLAAGMSFDIPNSGHKNPAHQVVIGLFTYIFVALYSVGMGPVPFTYSAECFPLEVRMVGMSLSVFVNLLGAGLLALFVPVLTSAIGHLRLLVIFAALNVVALILVFFFLRETSEAAVRIDAAAPGGRQKAMSLEELNYAFGVKNMDHVDYQVEQVLWNYFIKRYVLRRKDWKKPPKFYIWSVGQGGGNTASQDDQTAENQSERDVSEREKDEISLHSLEEGGRRTNELVEVDSVADGSIGEHNNTSVEKEEEQHAPEQEDNKERWHAGAVAKEDTSQGGGMHASSSDIRQLFEDLQARVALLEAVRQ